MRGLHLMSKDQLEIDRLNLELEHYKSKDRERLRQKEILMEQEARLLQMDNILSMFSHQLKQPLSAISSSIINIKVTQMLQESNFEHNQELDEFLALNSNKISLISEYVESLSNIIDDFRDFFRIEKVQESILISTLIDKTLILMQFFLEKNSIHIEKNLEIDHKVEVYKNQIIQLFMTIIKDIEERFSIAKESKIVIDIQSFSNGVTVSIYDHRVSLGDEYLEVDPECNISSAMLHKNNNVKLLVKKFSTGFCYEVSFYF